MERAWEREILLMLVMHTRSREIIHSSLSLFSLNMGCCCSKKTHVVVFVMVFRRKRYYKENFLLCINIRWRERERKKEKEVSFKWKTRKGKRNRNRKETQERNCLFIYKRNYKFYDDVILLLKRKKTDIYC